jgi:purine-binding chemotaxis protein CheW
MESEWKVIVFALGQEEYGVNVEKVKTIERMLPITRLIKTPEFIKGVINLRGVVIPVIDLRRRFGLPAAEYTDQTRILIVSENDMEVGLIVESANDVLDISSDQVDDPPEIAGGIRAKYFRGVARVGDNRMLILTDLQAVLDKSDLTAATTI